MTATTQTGLWIAFVVLTLGALYFGTKAWAWRRKEGMEFPLKSFFIALWAATLYLTMITGQTVDVINGQEAFWGRYIDWSVTTPLLLGESSLFFLVEQHF